MEEALERLNRELEKEGYPALSHGIGIQSGRVVAANIGSPDRLSYLLVGDTVNLASRLQALTRDLAVTLVVSKETVAGLADGGRAAGLVPHPEPLHVRGRDEALQVFTTPSKHRGPSLGKVVKP